MLRVEEAARADARYERDWSQLASSDILSVDILRHLAGVADRS
jgi:hypothetical protein